MRAARRDVLGMGLGASAMALAGEAAAVAIAGADPRIKALAALAAGLVRDGHSAGVQIGVAVEGRKPFVAGYGSANLETGTPVSPGSVLRIASCTKQFTAAAILLLAERGKLALDQPIEAFFPGFPKGDQVTAHQLLTHTSGLHDYVYGGMPADAAGEWQRDPDRHRFLAKMAQPFDFEPGTYWSYSNSGYALLGELIEKLSGKSYAQFVHASLIEPAGMEFTALDEPGDVVPGRAAGYSLDADRPGAFRNAFWGGLPIAEGGLRSTTLDLLRWNAALFGERILSRASLDRMTAPARVKDGRPVGEAHFAPPGQNPGKPPAFVSEPNYGCGLEVCRMFGRRVIWHSGGIRGFNALLFHFADDGLDLALLSNTDNGLVTAFEAFLRAATGGPR
ncbi:beta-lactamase family protein [Sphingomonas sp. LB-2]|uniref:serine hydrolase domain-containing protein n=1 Tax=Sphingomonas caeni TaxID=2984949 RepID=UPI00223123CA|nr:serine hydrolase domain-containing protein [Sphingomonas caeni]MCW3848354.1 beta-lactamase family protein [Sphingomonas caeni]